MHSCGLAFGPVSKCKFMFGARATARAIASGLFPLQPMYDSQLHLIISCYYSVHTHSVLGSAKWTTCISFCTWSWKTTLTLTLSSWSIHRMLWWLCVSEWMHEIVREHLMIAEIWFSECILYSCMRWCMCMHTYRRPILMRQIYSPRWILVLRNLLRCYFNTTRFFYVPFHSFSLSFNSIAFCLVVNNRFFVCASLPVVGIHTCVLCLSVGPLVRIEMKMHLNTIRIRLCVYKTREEFWIYRTSILDCFGRSYEALTLVNKKYLWIIEQCIQLFISRDWERWFRDNANCFFNPHMKRNEKKKINKIRTIPMRKMLRSILDRT